MTAVCARRHSISCTQRLFSHSPPSRRRTGSATSSRAFSSGHRHHVAAAPFGLARLELLGLEFPAGPEVSAYRLAPPERAIEFGALAQRRPETFLRLSGTAQH